MVPPLVMHEHQPFSTFRYHGRIVTESEPHLALKTAMMPRDTNKYGTIFGGVLLSYIDLAGGIGADHVIQSKGWPSRTLVTVAMERIEFKQPVLVGDTVSFWTTITRIGTTSITVHVTVQSERGGKRLDVTEATCIYVAVELDADDEERHPVPLCGN